MDGMESGSMPVAPSDGGGGGWRFDHLGVVVASLEKGRASIGPVFGIDEWTQPVADLRNGVHIQFGRDRAGVVYELLEPLGENSPVAGALKGRKNLLNHVAYLVDDLAKTADFVRAAGAVPTAPPAPAIAYGGAPIQFFLTAAGFIFELIEAKDGVHPLAAKQEG